MELLVAWCARYEDIDSNRPCTIFVPQVKTTIGLAKASASSDGAWKFASSATDQNSHPALALLRSVRTEPSVEAKIGMLFRRRLQRSWKRQCPHRYAYLRQAVPVQFSTSNRYRKWFGASISFIIRSNVWLCSRWTSFLLEHRRMCRIVSSSIPSQHLHIADILTSKWFALASVYHCWVYCFEKCALVIELFPNFLALLTVISSSINSICSVVICNVNIISVVLVDNPR